jgi:hypothetical protein
MPDGPPRLESSLIPPFSKQRQFPRFVAEFKVETAKLGQKPLRGHACDVSEGGLGATIVGEMSVGDQVLVEFSGAPLLRPVKTSAIVRNRTGFRYGFEFLALSREQRTMITAASLFMTRL